MKKKTPWSSGCQSHWEHSAHFRVFTTINSLRCVLRDGSMAGGGGEYVKDNDG